MSGRYAIASIAGVALEDEFGRQAKVDVVDGEALKTTLVGRTVVALDFTTHTLLAERGPQGVHFGLHPEWLPIGLLNEIVAAMEAALEAGEDFPVVASDSLGSPKLDDISVLAVPDFRALGDGKYFTRAQLSNDFARDILFRFISTGPAD
ncbi:MAG: hypothetical protein ABW208_10145 [Pyrinomonadaceae bacterium]